MLRLPTIVVAAKEGRAGSSREDKTNNVVLKNTYGPLEA
jgi:hypothetical protein